MKQMTALLLVWVLGLFTGYTPDVKHTISSLNAPVAMAGVGTATSTDPKLDLGWLEAAKESTVVVSTPTGHGSGVCVGWDGDRAIVLTAKHVVDDLKPDVEIFAIFPYRLPSGRTDISLSGLVLRLSPDYDLALVSFRDPRHLLKPRLISMESPVAGRIVIAIGYPLDIYPAPATIGTSNGLVLEEGVTFLSHSASAWFGNSGGPLFDRSGVVVGIVVQMYGYNGHAASDMQLAVPCESIWKFLKAE